MQQEIDSANRLGVTSIAPNRKVPTRRQVLKGATVGGLAGAAASGFAGFRTLEEAIFAKAGNDMNIALVVIDALRPDHVGSYGGTVRTPNLDDFAASATRFTRPYAEAMPTIPMRRALHTGLRTYPAPNWHPYRGNPKLVGWQPIPNDQTTIAELLRNAGYTTALLADTAMLFLSSMNFQRGFEAFDWFRGGPMDDQRPAGLAPTEQLRQYLHPEQFGTKNETQIRQILASAKRWRTEEDWPAARMFTAAADLVPDLADLQPFFLAVDTYQVHEPWLLPPRYASMYGEPRRYEPVLPRYGEADYLSAADIDRMRQLYAGSVTFADRLLGRLLNSLADNNLLDSTLVVVVSDHGVLLGEHGYVGKPYEQLYPELSDIVLVIRHPTRGHGTSSDVFAGTHDIVPTMTAATDINVDSDYNFDGLDLFSAGSPANGRTYATALYHTTIWTRDSRYLLIAPNYGDDLLLFDLEEDPQLKHNIWEIRPDVAESLLRHAKEDAGGAFPRYDGLLAWRQVRRFFS